MPNTYQTLGSLFTAIANAIRGKTGGSAAIKADDFPSAIGAIPTGGTDVSDTTAVASDVLSGKDFYLANGTKASGTIPSQAAQTITPTTSDQTIAAGKYLTGAQTIKGDANLVSANIAAGVSIFGVEGSHEGGGGDADLDDFVQGTLQALVTDATSIRNYAAYNNTGPTSVSAPEATTIGQYAFQGCSNLASASLPKATNIQAYAFQSLANLASIVIPLCTTLGNYAFQNCQKGVLASALKATSISSYAMQNFGHTAATGFAWEPDSNATVYDYAFAGSRITSINGKVTYIGSYAFQDAEWLESYANTATLSTLSQYAFRNAGKSRADTTVALELDMHTGTFTSVQQYTFAGLVNAIVTLPTTVTSLAGNAFNGISGSLVIITGNTPTMSATTVFDGWTNSLVAVPYNNLYSTKQAANWNAISSMLVGYAPAGTFVAGASLPTTDSGSHDIYWSTDLHGEDWVTECPSGSPILYAHLGSKTGWWIDVDVTGATVTVTADGVAYAITDGRATVPQTAQSIEIGVTYPTGWDTSITLNGETVTQFPITGLSARDYTLAGLAYDPSIVHTWGATWAPGSSTKWTRTDDAANYADPVPYMPGVSNYGSPFDDFDPWASMVASEDANAGTVVAIKKFWYKLEANGTGGLSVKISNAELPGFSVCPACADRGDGDGERDVVYVGRYRCGSAAWKSATGQKPKVNITRSTARSSIHNLGSDIWLLDFATRFTIWLLYIVEYAEWNTQAAIGYGCGDGSGTSGVMGYTDSMPYHTGTTQNAKTTYGLGTQYRNIEGLWDYVRDWIGGCYNNSSGLNIILNLGMDSDSGNGTSIGTPKSGYPSKFTVTSAAGLPAFFIPSEASGSASTGSCDGWYFYAAYPAVYGGGSYVMNQNSGLFYLDGNYAHHNSADAGARLLKLPSTT